MNPAEFDRLVAAAYARIPARFRRRLKNIALVVEPEPGPAQLARGRTPRGSTLLGLYEGRPLTRRSVFEPFAMPDRITIFQGPHERLATSPEHLAASQPKLFLLRRNSRSCKESDMRMDLMSRTRGVLIY
jgi:predicted Zn-dependent protease with MMP-like domain